MTNAIREKENKLITDLTEEIYTQSPQTIDKIVRGTS